MSKMQSPGILLKKQLTFVNPAWKFYTLDDKRLLIMRVITSLFKNKSLLKILFFKFNVKKKKKHFLVFLIFDDQTKYMVIPFITNCDTFYIKNSS